MKTILGLYKPTKGKITFDAKDLSLFEGVLPLLDALKARGHLLATKPKGQRFWLIPETAIKNLLNQGVPNGNH